MFERYTEKARRTIFFARYEASQFGSPYIETEHLLLALLRENKSLSVRFLKDSDGSETRRAVESKIPVRATLRTSVDLPLAAGLKRVLKHAADEADRLKHQHIGTEHLYLGLLIEDSCLAARLLRERGVTLENARDMVSTSEPEERYARARLRAQASEPPIRIHGQAYDTNRVQRRVAVCRQFHWEKKSWTPSDVVIRRGAGTVSFDLSLAATSPEMELVQGGWKVDECAVCFWKLSDQLGPDHAAGFTNGRDWICAECYEKFWSHPDFLGGGFGEIT